jgi:hypothetical protein
VLVAKDIGPEHVQFHAVRARRLAGHLDRDLVQVDGNDRSEAEPHGRHRNDARAASGIEQTATVKPCEQLDGRAGRRMCARPESPAGVDDDRRLVGWRRDPGRPDPQPAGSDRAVELLPAVLPAGHDALGRHVRERTS